jgi:ubiquinone/menaquinone biosynthesis C-methylase UbiE
VNCDPIARWYRWFEYAGFGRGLERRRFAFLPEVAQARRILLLGDGDGRFLARLVAINRDAAIDYVDSSHKMLKLARSRNSCDRVTFHHADALQIELPATTYDLIVAHFFLDCFNRHDAERLIERVAAAACPAARWLVSEFRQAPQGWRALWARLWLRVLYLFFRVATGLRTRQLIDHHPLLERHGFQLAHAESARFGLLVSELWSRPVRQ